MLLYGLGKFSIVWGVRVSLGECCNDTRGKLLGEFVLCSFKPDHHLLCFLLADPEGVSQVFNASRYTFVEDIDYCRFLQLG